MAEISELNATKARLETETVEMTRRLEERDCLVVQLTRTKNTQSQQIEEIKQSLGDETLAKTALAHAIQTHQSDFEALRRVQTSTTMIYNLL